MSLNLNDKNKEKYIANMVSNLPVLRAMLHLTQAELASLTGVSRQHLAMVENGTRKLTWQAFLSLMFVFTQNRETNYLLELLGIYPKELRRVYSDIEPARGKQR